MKNINLRSRAEFRALPPQNPVVPGRKQRDTVTTQSSAGVGSEPWPEPAEQAGLGCTGTSSPSALTPAAGTPMQSCLASPRPSAARRAVRCQGERHLALVQGVLSHPRLTEVVLSFPCLYAIHTPLAIAAAPASGAAIGTLAAQHQSGHREGCEESVEAEGPPRDQFRASPSATGGSFGEKLLSPSI